MSVRENVSFFSKGTHKGYLINMCRLNVCPGKDSAWNDGRGGKGVHKPICGCDLVTAKTSVEHL